MRIETNRLVLRNFEESDIDDYYEVVSQKNVGPRCGWAPYSTKEDALERLKYDMTLPYKFAIELKDGKKVVGSIDLRNLESNEKFPFIKEEDVKNTKEVGFYISEDYWNRGYMTEALEVVIATAFEVLEYDYVVASYFEPNVASGKVQSRCGMQLMGKLKDYTTWYETGEKCDLVMMQITREEYSKNKTNKEIEISE